MNTLLYHSDLLLVGLLLLPPFAQYAHGRRMLAKGASPTRLAGMMATYQLLVLAPILFVILTKLPMRLEKVLGLITIGPLLYFFPFILVQGELAYSSYLLDRRARHVDWRFRDFVKTTLRPQLLVAAFVLPALGALLFQEWLLNRLPSVEQYIDEHTWAIAAMLLSIFGFGFLTGRIAWRWSQPEYAAVDPFLANRLKAFGERIDYVPNQIQVLPTVGGKVANAFVVGLRTGKLRILLTDYLIQNLTPEEIEAIFAHEAGHAKLGHIKQRLWLTAAILPLMIGLMLFWPWMVIRLLDGPFILAVLPLLPVGFLPQLVLNPLFRRQEFAADRWAAAATGQPEVLAEALQHLDRLNHMETQRLPRWLRLLIGHPLTPLRVAALAEQAKEEKGKADAIDLGR